MEQHDQFEQANQRARELQASFPPAASAHYDRRIGRVVIRLNSGLDVAFSPHNAQGLEDASPADLDPIEISPSGFGIHFPKLDADLYLPALLAGFLGSEKWMASRLGAAGGKSRSAAKAFAAKRNGRLGGRPRKAHELIVRCYTAGIVSSDNGGVMPAKKHTVKFVATKTVNEPTEVKFTTKAGKKVDFEAEKPVKEKVKVQFQAKDK